MSYANCYIEQNIVTTLLTKVENNLYTRYTLAYIFKLNDQASLHRTPEKPLTHKHYTQ